jgi:hypothetical protein
MAAPAPLVQYLQEHHLNACFVNNLPVERVYKRRLVTVLRPSQDVGRMGLWLPGMMNGQSRTGQLQFLPVSSVAASCSEFAAFANSAPTPSPSRAEPEAGYSSWNETPSFVRGFVPVCSGFRWTFPAHVYAPNTVCANYSHTIIRCIKK